MYMYTMLQVVVASLCCSLAWILYCVAIIARRRAVVKRQFPGPPTTSFLFGNLAETNVPDRHKVILKWVEEYGPNIALRMAWVNVLIITEPKLVAEILHSSEVDKVREAYDSVAVMMSSTGHPDLVTGMTDNWWRLVRKGVAPAFSPANIRRGYKHVAACGDKLVQVLRSKGADAAVDVDHACLCETIDTIGLYGFRHDFNALGMFQEGKHERMMTVMLTSELEVQRRLQHPLRHRYAWFTKEGREALRSFAEFQQITRELLEDMRASGGPADDDGSIGAHLLRIRDAEGKPLPDERVLPHIGMFFFAGFDTTGHTMAWTLYLVSQHPEVEARIVEELRSLNLLATPQQPRVRHLEYDDLGKLTYLSCAIKESMRIKPVVATGTIRIARTRATTLDGGRLHIPPMASMWTPSHTMHNSTHNWGGDAREYKPERWLQTGTEYALHTRADQGTSAADTSTDRVMTGAEVSSAGANYELGIRRDYKVGLPEAARVKRFIPFSDGRRDCVGQALGRLNYTSTLARLLGNFHFELAPESGGAAAVEAEEAMNMTLQPGPKGLLMRCIPRALGKA